MCEFMLPYEAIIIQGTDIIMKHSGYGSEFEFQSYNYIFGTFFEHY